MQQLLRRLLVGVPGHLSPTAHAVSSQRHHSSALAQTCRLEVAAWARTRSRGTLTVPRQRRRLLWPSMHTMSGQVKGDKIAGVSCLGSQIKVTCKAGRHAARRRRHVTQPLPQLMESPHAPLKTMDRLHRLSCPGSAPACKCENASKREIYSNLLEFTRDATDDVSTTRRLTHRMRGILKDLSVKVSSPLSPT